MMKGFMLGDEALLKCEKVGFLASRRVPPEAVMRCLDWATRMRDEGVCVMSGFQSPLEKEVLNILLKGTSPLILVLARRMWDERHIPTLFRKPLAEGRLLVVSPVSQSIRRVDARSAAQRNRYIRDHADSLFLGALDPDGSLTDLLPLPSHLYKCEGAPPFRSPMSREICRARREFGIICVK